MATSSEGKDDKKAEEVKQEKTKEAEQASSNLGNLTNSVLAYFSESIAENFHNDKADKTFNATRTVSLDRSGGLCLSKDNHRTSEKIEGFQQGER